MTYVNGTSHYQASPLRMDPTYVFWYTHSLIVHPFLTTTVAPILVLFVLNIFIYRC